MPRDAAHVPPVTSGPYPIREGCSVRPWVDGEPAFLRICEAVESARKSVWVTIAFLESDFRMPGAHGSLFDVLDRAHARGLDVQVIFWRSLPLEEHAPDQHFPGTSAQREQLAARGSRFQARWDRAEGPYCQHQKSWLVDAGEPGEIAFVGGINLDVGSVAAPGHPFRGTPSVHDVYVEVRGPAATDVHHNFVQRWNEASDRELADGLWPDARAQSELAFLVPGVPHGAFAESMRRPESAPFAGALAALGAHPRFTLAGIAANAGPGVYFDIYVHAKIALVDDAWCTIGSTNVASRSFFGDTELNASFWHGATVRALRVELLREHLGVDASELDDRGSLRLFAEHARKNTDRRAAGQPLQGLAFAIDPARYGRRG